MSKSRKKSLAHDWKVVVELGIRQLFKRAIKAVLPYGLLKLYRYLKVSLSNPRKDREKAGEFTAHNIILGDGTLTRPKSNISMSEYPLFQSSKRLLELIFPGEKTKLTLVDLACLEGGYTVEFARLGFKALGIEVRDSNFANCQYVKNHVNTPNLRFIQDDVWNLERYGIFDVVFCSGILYHLDKPKTILEIMEKCCKKAIIIDTHYSIEVKNTRFNLSDEFINEGLPGRWYYEHDDISKEQLDEMKWASWENAKSFWIRREFLIQAM